ncbi:hypothetical protein AAE478_001506 [Parahypoxylon ruwenzoriense]
MAAAVATQSQSPLFPPPVNSETSPAETQVPGRQRAGRHDVSAIINYYKEPGDGSPPMPIVIADNTVKNERPMVPQQHTIRDVTGAESTYALDEHGFQFVRHASQLAGLAAFQDEARVAAEYYPECVRLLKEITGAPRVHVWDHKTRSGPSNWHALGRGNRSARGPLLRAHVDQSYAGAELVLRRHFPGEADELVGRRYQIINLWRPIRPVLKSPLCVASAPSIPESDLVAASIIYPSDRDETWTILPGARHEWYYKHRQRPDEVLLIKCYDSNADVPARRAPHSAFEDPETADEEPRESIEARALVFYDE